MSSGFPEECDFFNSCLKIRVSFSHHINIVNHINPDFSWRGDLISYFLLSAFLPATNKYFLSASRVGNLETKYRVSNDNRIVALNVFFSNVLCMCWFVDKNRKYGSGFYAFHLRISSKLVPPGETYIALQLWKISPSSPIQTLWRKKRRYFSTGT